LTGTPNIFDFTSETVLVIGYGNPCRFDDGLGPALATRLDALAITGLSIEIDYQLVVEHAHEVAKYDYVVFADSAIGGKAPFSFMEIQKADKQQQFSSHGLTPEAVMFVARSMFGAKTKGYILGICGYEFEGFGEELSNGAKNNLEAALRFILGLCGVGIG